MAGPVDLSALMDQANAFSTQAQSAASGLFNLSADQAVSASKDADTQIAIGANTAVIDSAKQNADLATQQARIKGANALGTNLKEQGEQITGLSSDILSLMSQKAQALQVIRDKQSVGFFDDPLQHIINQFTINDDIDKHNAIDAQLTAKETDLDTLNKLTQSTSITQNQLTEPITQASITASAANTAATASILSQKAQRDALSYNAQGISVALSASNLDLKSRFEAVTAQNQQNSSQIALEHLTLARQEFDWRKDEKAIADKARQEGKDVDVYTMQHINDGLTRMGMAPIPGNSPKGSAALAAIKSGQPGNIYAEAFKISTDSEAAGGATILAPSPARAIQLLNNLPLKLSPAQDQVRDILATARDTVAADPAIDQKNVGQVQAAQNAVATKILAQQSRKINPGDSSNVFQIPPLGALINAATELQSTPFISKVIAPSLAAGNDLSNPDKVFAAGIAAVNAGTISLEDMTEGIASTYQRGVAVNLEARQLQSLGLNLTPQKKGDPSLMTYNVPIHTNYGNNLRLGSGVDTVDMTSVISVSRAINKSMANQALSTFTSVTP